MSIARIAIVTGAARGIGEAVALRLANDGLDVAVTDVSASAESLNAVAEKIRKTGRRAVAVTGDVSKESDVKAVIDKVVDSLGGVDVMVANAGIVMNKPAIETTLEEYNRVMSINATGIFLSFKYAALQMIKQGRGGRIIGASSLAGKTGMTNLSAYSASKFAVRGLTQTCALEWARYNITVNSYCPGIIYTPMLTESKKVEDDKDAPPIEAVRLQKSTPGAQPSVIGNLVSFLAQKDNNFVSGQSININGGIYFD
ncbi:NAD-binding protein [Sparassis latifolia]